MLFIRNTGVGFEVNGGNPHFPHQAAGSFDADAAPEPPELVVYMPFAVKGAFGVDPIDFAHQIQVFSVHTRKIIGSAAGNARGFRLTGKGNGKMMIVNEQRFLIGSKAIQLFLSQPISTFCFPISLYRFS